MEKRRIPPAILKEGRPTPKVSRIDCPKIVKIMTMRKENEKAWSAIIFFSWWLKDSRMEMKMKIVAGGLIMAKKAKKTEIEKLKSSCMEF